MAITACRIVNNEMTMVPITEVVPDFQCVASEQKASDVAILPYPLNGVANRVGENAIVLNCLTTSGKTVPVITSRFTV